MKPVDLQMLLPKSTEVAKSRHVEQARPETAQQQFAVEARRQVIAQGRTVRKAESARGGTVNRDGRRGGTADAGKGKRQPAAGPGAAARQPELADAGTSAAAAQTPPERDGKGRFIDIVLGFASGGGNR